MELHLRPKEAANYTGTTEEFLMNLCRRGHGPIRFMPSPKTTLFRKSDLDAWMRSWELREPTNQCAAPKKAQDTGLRPEVSR